MCILYTTDQEKDHAFWEDRARKESTEWEKNGKARTNHRLFNARSDQTYLEQQSVIQNNAFCDEHTQNNGNAVVEQESTKLSPKSPKSPNYGSTGNINGDRK